MASMGGIPEPTCELEQWVLVELAKRQRSGESVSALLIGIGTETQALRMAEAGAQVLLLSDREAISHHNVSQCPTAVLDDEAAALPFAPFDIILSQRNFSTLRYDAARKALRACLRRLKIGGKLFVSLYGIHSDLGDNYPDGGKLVSDRLALVSPEAGSRYGLTEPVCLYAERNLFSLLMEAGGAVLKTSTSALGHVRGVAARI
ncbi:MAG: class I SAM-dependent methyltransferase [Betaproteobacteria bacterium]|uniref:Class I SAM-dependent methyltransferase n=1 Tax=Candidatus Proximibacter danicus TaxID=2954365 RepID=A0A9D7K4D9_9PROT|nr:class I SAM-dependent methyltransferase [Candidatus Proximibacter danicus]MBK9447230.1 class I SAM-dependent methyltransferase [Betaproteobacteria bacterium]